MFRGFLFKGLLGSKLGEIGTVLVTAGAWAGIHFQYEAYGKVTVFIFGLLLGYARLRTRSLYTPLYLHSLMNLLATLEAAWF